MAENRKNLILPGNPRYQPKSLQGIFGYDNLMRWVAMVELATMRVLAELGVISSDDIGLLTPEIEVQVLAIRTTEVDEIERKVTKHDIRAWVRKAQEILPVPLRKWGHLPLTSYDPIDTGRTLQFSLAYQQVLAPEIKETALLFTKLVRRFADELQIGRTHGQHALPITVGFWLATILSRILYNAEMMALHTGRLVGKISGAVGAYNAETGLGIAKRCGEKSFEERVLEKLGLKPARISTQILPPEPLAYFLHSCVMLSAALAQFGRDCRNLMRSEIGEVAEEFGEGQVGSSTMAHKRNPITFENLEGTYWRTKNEFGKVMDTLISEHQRDLVGSSVARDFPIIVVNLVHQLESLLKKDKSDRAFLERITVDKRACRRNFRQNSRVILAEPLYIALQMAGYSGDAHELVNRRLMAVAQKKKRSLIEVAEEVAQQDDVLRSALGNIPSDVIHLLHVPKSYTGRAREKALEIAELAEAQMAA